MIGNKEGFQFREQARTTWRLDFKKGAKEIAIWNRNNTIRNNVMAYNRDAQLWGWFDVNDERMWPVAMQENKVDNTRSAVDNAAPYGAKDNTGQPVGLSLEKLNFSISNNVYAVAPNQDVFHWGAEWKRNKAYNDLGRLRSELGLEKGGVIAPLVFGDYLARDFRVPSNSPALENERLSQRRSARRAVGHFVEIIWLGFLAKHQMCFKFALDIASQTRASFIEQD